MNVLKHLVVFVLSLCFFCVIDLWFLRMFIIPEYVAYYSHILRMDGGSLSVSPRWVMSVYVLMVIGLYYFCVYLRSASLWDALRRGAMLGLLMYGVFDLTNYAIIEGWSLPLSVFEILWGMVICGLTAIFMRIVTVWLLPR